MGCLSSKGVSDKERDKSRQQLMRVLGVSELQEKQIRVCFEEKNQYEQQQILKLIYRNWKTLQHESSLIEALKEIKFVKSADKQQSADLLYKPNELFDPGDVLLKSVFSGEAHKFPAQSFGKSDKWLNILRKTGLRNSGDANVLLECAKRVELLGAKSMNNTTLCQIVDHDDTTFEVPSEIWSLAETVMGAICKNADVFRHKKSCKILSEIACIPAEKGHPFEREYKGGVKRVLCSYNEAVLLKDWPLAWTVAPIIFNQSFVPPEYSWESLQLRSPPPFSVVLNHLQVNYTLSTVIQVDGSRITSTLSTLEEATIEVLQYLDRIWDTISSSDVLKMQEIKLFFVGNKAYIAKPCVVFTRCGTRDFTPIAYELPSCYLPFMKILRQLGVREILSISSALSILRDHKNYYGQQRMCPNRIRGVIEILHFICDEMEQQQQQQQQNSDSSEWESLVVPDDSCRLVHPNSCVYIDPRGSLYLKYIDTSKLKFVHRDLSERLCLAFGVKKLSDVVVEELDCADSFHTIEEIESVSVADIRVTGGRVDFGTGLLGKKVTPEDVEMFMFHSRKPFYKGEIVAWRRNETDEFKYGRVPQDTTPPLVGHPPYIFDLETSSGNTETVVSSHVWSFIIRKAKYLMPKDGHDEGQSIQVEQLDKESSSGDANPIQ